MFKALIRRPVEEMDFDHIDDFDAGTKQRKLTQLKPSVPESKATGTEQIAWRPERLENGKWACNHKCRDKTV